MQVVGALIKKQTMHQVTVLDIIKLCREIDETARDIYAKLSNLAGEGEMGAFWTQMSQEEAEHVEFWKRAALVQEFSELPELFENPTKTIEELKKSRSRSEGMLANCEREYSTGNAFTLAYRMEFYLLHPAFGVLFHLLGPTTGGSNPENDYESHIAEFIRMLEKHGNVTPEHELLGETIQRLWNENKRLAVQSSHDDLTGVLNRRGFLAISVQFAYLSQRAGSRIGIMMLDLDHFKSINDRLGHPVGDRVLKQTAQILKNRLRESDVIGRYGGEEFIVLVTDFTAGSLQNLAESLREAIETSCNAPGTPPATVSIGFAETKLGREVQEDYNRLIQEADAALYQAKAAGRNRVAEYKPEKT